MLKDEKNAEEQKPYSFGDKMNSGIPQSEDGNYDLSSIENLLPDNLSVDEYGNLVHIEK